MPSASDTLSDAHLSAVTCDELCRPICHSLELRALGKFGTFHKTLRRVSLCFPILACARKKILVRSTHVNDETLDRT